ncbi:MAG: hypothetical protein WDO13_11345 [Verrucomicrobiota bacterium]
MIGIPAPRHRNAPLAWALALVLACLAAVAPLRAQAPPPLDVPTSTVVHDELLAHLAGYWTLTGTMEGKEVRQYMTARWIVQEQFLQLHFVTANVPINAGCEAYDILMADPKTGRYSGHRFEASGPIPVETMGFGQRQGNEIDIDFDYPEGQVKWTLLWKPGAGQWELRERRQEKKVGHWVDIQTGILRPR